MIHFKLSTFLAIIMLQGSYRFRLMVLLSHLKLGSLEKET